MVPLPEPGSDNFADVATYPVVANGGSSHRDWSGTVELISAAFRLGLSPGQEPALAPCLPINLPRGDRHGFATSYEGTSVQ
jgi:hypothetical protein